MAKTLTLHPTHRAACVAARKVLGPNAKEGRDFIVTQLAPFDGSGTTALPGGFLWESFSEASARANKA